MHDMSLRIAGIVAASAFIAVATSAVLSDDAVADEVYVVESGDTLGAIASQFGCSSSDIRGWNDLDDDMIRIGQELDIRSSGGGSSTGSSSSSQTYTITDGDTLSGIASAHGCSVDDIVGWNSGLDPDRIRIGQELRIRSTGGRSSGGYQSYTIGSGDTVGGIASRFGVSIDDIVGWNSGLNPDRIRIGQVLRIRANGRAQRSVEYEVQNGDYLGRIASRHNVTIDDLERWNSGLDPDRIRIGQVITIMVEGPEVASESIGRANDGRLVNGELLPEHRGYNIRDEDRAWGTNETVGAILDAFDHLRRQHPDAPVVAMHDLSYEEGGDIRGHASHESGRDADIGFFHDGCDDECDYVEFDADEFDNELNWTLLSYWIDNDLVEYIFIDYSYQRELYGWLEENGESERNLREWFQYPSGRDTARGIIRHERNHEDHMHVRFGCLGDDPRCR